MLFPVMFNATNRLANDEHFVIGEVIAFGPVAWPATGDHILDRVSQQWVDTVESATCVVQFVTAVVAWLMYQFRVFLEWNREFMVTAFRSSTSAVKSTTNCQVRCSLLFAIARIASLCKAGGIFGVSFAEFSQRLIDATNPARLICRVAALIARSFERHEFRWMFISVTLKACSRFLMSPIAICHASTFNTLTSIRAHLFRWLNLIARCASRKSTKAFLADLTVQRERSGCFVANSALAFALVIRVIALLRHATLTDSTQAISRRSFMKLIERLYFKAFRASPAKIEATRAVFRVERKRNRWECFQACSALLIARAIEQLNALTAFVSTFPVKVIQRLRNCAVRADPIFSVAVFTETRTAVLTSVVSQFAFARSANSFHWKLSF